MKPSSSNSRQNKKRNEIKKGAMMAESAGSFQEIPGNRGRWSLALSLSLCMLVSACATTGGPQPGQMGAATATSADDCTQDNPMLTAAELAMCQDAQEASLFNETVAGGALLGVLGGAALGALAGILSGGDEKAMMQGALLGSAVGGIMGGVDGYVTGKAQQTGNNQVRMIDSMTADVAKDNANLMALVESSSKVLADSRIRLAKVTADQKAKRATLEQVAEEKARVEANRDRLQAWLDAAKEKRDHYVEASAQMRSQNVSTAELDAKIAQMDRQVAQLENTVAGLNAAAQIART